MQRNSLMKGFLNSCGPKLIFEACSLFKVHSNWMIVTALTLLSKFDVDCKQMIDVMYISRSHVLDHKSTKSKCISMEIWSTCMCCISPDHMFSSLFSMIRSQRAEALQIEMLSFFAIGYNKLREALFPNNLTSFFEVVQWR